MPRAVLGRRNLCDDLSARKPASCLVQGNRFPRSRVIGRTVIGSCLAVSLFFVDLLLRSLNKGRSFFLLYRKHYATLRCKSHVPYRAKSPIGQNAQLAEKKFMLRIPLARGTKAVLLMEVGCGSVRSTLLFL